jgi:uncharacterized protein YecE (DUF72 family)
VKDEFGVSHGRVDGPVYPCPVRHQGEVCTSWQPSGAGLAPVWPTPTRLRLRARIAGMLELRVGTSGFSYVPWKGVFYPEKLKNDAMLKFYAGVFSAVEINNTFYRLPAESMLAKWKGEVPDTFRFCLKMSQRVTHHAKLVDTKELTDRFFAAKRALGALAGPSLIQLPPYLKKDVARLETFLAQIDPGEPLVFEFGSQTWMDEDVYTVLRARGASVCLVDDEKRPFQWVQTAPFGSGCSSSTKTPARVRASARC